MKHHTAHEQFDPQIELSAAPAFAAELAGIAPAAGA